VERQGGIVDPDLKGLDTGFEGSRRGFIDRDGLVVHAVDNTRRMTILKCFERTIMSVIVLMWFQGIGELSGLKIDVPVSQLVSTPQHSEIRP
jgi:hypothetical protein